MECAQQGAKSRIVGVVKDDAIGKYKPRSTVFLLGAGRAVGLRTSTVVPHNESVRQTAIFIILMLIGVLSMGSVLVYWKREQLLDREKRLERLICVISRCKKTRRQL